MTVKGFRTPPESAVVEAAEPKLVDLRVMVGSLVVERYEYGTRAGGAGVQWLAEVVSKNGDLVLIQACKTRKEALETLGRS